MTFRKTVKRGEIYYYDFGTNEGSIQNGCRPVLIVQCDEGNQASETTVVAAITTSKKRYLPTHISLDESCGLREPSIPKNPCINATLPKEDHTPRQIWDADTLFKAIELCEDDLLKLALNLAFACSLRMGEMLALTWDCIDIREESIKAGRAYLFVNKELQRVNRDALDKLNDKGVILKFPAVFARNTTLLVLKEPKTKTSVRKVFIPATVAEMLRERHRELEEYKELFGDEFIDYNLVFCNPNGRPMEGSVINRGLSKLIKDNDLPPVVFHSLRHSSITYKLKLNGGDMKSVQGDSGHAQVKMVADVYSHILDDDRRLNAQRFEEAFYKPQTKELEQQEPVDIPSASDSNLIAQLLANPQLCAMLKDALLKSET